jgi:hypothetical protein
MARSCAVTVSEETAYCSNNANNRCSRLSFSTPEHKRLELLLIPQILGFKGSERAVGDTTVRTGSGARPKMARATPR